MTLQTPVIEATDSSEKGEIERHEFAEMVPLGMRIVNLLGILIPFAGFIAVIVLLWGRGFDWLHAGLLIGMYFFSAIGITIGYHRYFCHRAFQTHRVVQLALAIFGSLAVEGPVLKWVAMHRCHHKHSDKPDDPHSPHHHHHLGGILGTLRGLWHAHMGWIFREDPGNLTQYVPDLNSDRMLRFVSQSWTLWAALGLIIPAVLGGLLTMTWTGALLGFLWGGLARVFLVHHITWSINSVCHIWGTRPFRSHDHSRNNFIFGILGMGEGWHNNHHAFPTSARHGLKWWQIDASYWIIVMMSWMRLAWDIKVPNLEKMSYKAAA